MGWLHNVKLRFPAKRTKFWIWKKKSKLSILTLMDYYYFSKCAYENYLMVKLLNIEIRIFFSWCKWKYILMNTMKINNRTKFQQHIIVSTFNNFNKCRMLQKLSPENLVTIAEVLTELWTLNWPEKYLKIGHGLISLAVSACSCLLHLLLTPKKLLTDSKKQISKTPRLSTAGWSIKRYPR